jgi:ABC-type antimicrobial peptide transport system permease subunit
VSQRWLWEIVGVVGDVTLSPTDRQLHPAMYVPAAQLPDWCCLYTVVRSSVDPLSLERSIQRVVASLDKDIPITDVQTMQDLTARRLEQPRFAMTLLGTFAALAVVLTLVGLYGVMMYAVTRRRREIGVRMALGAQRVAVLSLVLRQAGRLLMFGVAIGTIATLLSGFVLSSMLYGTGSRNPLVLALVSTGMIIAGLTAAYLPARRAASIEPMEALRSE